MDSLILPFLFECSSRIIEPWRKSRQFKVKVVIQIILMVSQVIIDSVTMRFLSMCCRTLLFKHKRLRSLKQNSHSFLSFPLISLLLSRFLSVSFGLCPLWNYGSYFQIWGLQPESLSSSTVQMFIILSLDLNLSQNQSHSQATRPFCIPTSPCVCVRIKMPAECQWETWLLFQLSLVHFRHWQIIYLHNVCYPSLFWGFLIGVVAELIILISYSHIHPHKSCKWF